MDNIIAQVKYSFTSTIDKAYGNLSASQQTAVNHILTHGTWWLPSYEPLQLTFNDLIKGIVPLELSKMIQEITCNKSATTEILGILFDNIYTKINQFWKERCEKVLHREKSLGITSKDKKAISSQANNFKRSYYVDHDIYDNLPNTVEGSSIMDRAVTFNSQFINFWRSLDFFSGSTVTNKVRFLRLI